MDRLHSSILLLGVAEVGGNFESVFWFESVWKVLHHCLEHCP